MKILSYLLFLPFFFAQCQSDPLLAKYKQPYQDLQQKIIDNKSLIKQTLSRKNLPPYQIIQFNNRKNILANQSLEEWVQTSNKKEGEIIEFLDKTKSFLNAIQQNEFFQPDSIQREKYATLQIKLKPLVAKLNRIDPEDSQEDHDLMLISNHDIELYLTKTLTNKRKFSAFLNEKLAAIDNLTKRLK